MRRLLLLPLLGLLPSCADEGEILGPPSLDAFEEKVVRGELTRDRPEVGSLSVGCTATLVAADIGISAAHCFNYGSRTQPGRYATFTLEPASGGSRDFVVDRYVSFSSDLGASDLSLFHLTTPVPADVARPAPIARTAPPAGSTLTVFGYGCTQRNTSTDWRKRKASFPMGTATNHLCPGDSGGPVFDDAAGTVLRINSGYWMDRFGTDIFGDVAQNHQAVLEQMRQWTSAPIPEPGQPGGLDPDPNLSTGVCGFDLPTRRYWTCSADGASRVRCKKGHGIEQEACAAGCTAGAGGQDSLCGDLRGASACGPEYAPYVDWTCTADGGHLLRCDRDQLQVTRCGNGCDPGDKLLPETCD